MADIPTEGDSRQSTPAAGTDIAQHAFSAQNRDPQTLLNTWNVLIESAADRITLRWLEVVNRSKIEEAQRSIVLRPLANQSASPINPDALMPLQDFKKKLEILPVSSWYANLIDGVSIDDVRTRTYEAIRISHGNTPEPAVSSDDTHAHASVLVNQIVAFEESVRGRYADQVQNQFTILNERQSLLRTLQQIDLIQALDHIATTHDVRLGSGLQYVKQLEQVFKLDHEARINEQTQREQRLNAAESKILHSNLSLLSAVISDGGAYLELTADKLSEKARRVLSGSSITDVVEAMVADSNIWPQYRAQQLDYELLSDMAKSAAKNFLDTVQHADYREVTRLASKTPENLLTQAIYIFLSDAIDRDPRFSSRLSRTQAYGWKFTTTEDLKQFPSNKLSAEERRKLLCNYFLSLLASSQRAGLPPPDEVNTQLKGDLGKYRQAVSELSPVIRLCAALYKVTTEANDQAASKPDTILVEASVRSAALVDLKRFLDLCEQVVPGCNGSYEDNPYRPFVESERANAVDQAAQLNQDTIKALTQRIESIRTYRAEKLTLAGLEGELVQAVESDKVIDQEISELSERRHQSGIKDALWRKFKSAQEEADLYELKRESAETLTRMQHSIEEQQKRTMESLPKSHDTLGSRLDESIEQIDLEISALEDQQRELERRKFV